MIKIKAFEHDRSISMNNFGEDWFNSVALRKLQILFILGLFLGLLVSFQLYLFLAGIIMHEPKYNGEPAPAAPARPLVLNPIILLIILVITIYLVIYELKISFISLEDIEVE